MFRLYQLLYVALILAVASCQPDSPQQAASPPASVPITVPNTASQPNPPPPSGIVAEPEISLPPYLHSYRRYVGRLDGQELVVELLPIETYRHDLEANLYFAHRSHTEFFEGGLTGLGEQLQSLKLGLFGDTAQATLVLRPPFGARLQAQWTAYRGASAQSVVLRENYTGAVRYEVLTARAEGLPIPPRVVNGDTVEASHMPAYTRAYLHLLGPDTLRPVLRHLQALPPRQMRKAVRNYLHNEAEGGCDDKEYLKVRLNGYNLLCYSVFLSSYMFGSAHPQRSEEYRIVDLHTGQPIRWQTWFRAGTEPALRKLIYRRLIASRDTTDYFDDVFNSRTGMQDLPEQYGLTPAGILAHYGDIALGPYVIGSTDVVLPFAEVAPLLNPGTPLDRILAARGLRAGR